MLNLVDPQHSLQSRHGVDGTLGSPGEIKNIRSKIMGSPGVRKDVCVCNNRSIDDMILVRKSAQGNFLE